MSDPSLEAAVRKARDRIDRLAADDGEFAVARKERGVTPEPLVGQSFDSDAAAERAREAATGYRESLRSVVPDFAAYELVVCEADAGALEVASVRESTAERRENGSPDTRRTATVTGRRRDEWLGVENAPVVYLTGRSEPLEDKFVARQIEAKL